MGLPRSKYVQEGQEGVYHCYSRCVRRAYLYGYDARTNCDYSHRKAWLEGRLRELAGIFAIDVCAYAVMENHYHAILRTRPEIAGGWTDREVARRWLTLFPGKCGLRGGARPSVEERAGKLANNRERIAVLRQRLSSLSWFMGRLNEFIARAANKEDGVKGRFWESRFKCQALLDEAAIAACMVYVDLNPIRAGGAETPEESKFTSIRERIRAWRKETMGRVSCSALEGVKARSDLADGADLATHWLCPIGSKGGQRGILQMTVEEYIDLVDKSGRMIRTGKRGAIAADLEPILLRIGANAQAWTETISGFGEKFSLVAGLVANVRKFADQLGRRWFKGAAAARVAFASPPAQLA